MGRAAPASLGRVESAGDVIPQLGDLAVTPSPRENYPVSLDLLLRIANALRDTALPPDMPPPRQRQDGSYENDVWIVVANTPPHFVQGLGTVEQCLALEQGPAPSDWANTQQTETARTAYGPYPRSTGSSATWATSSDRMLIITHRHTDPKGPRGRRGAGDTPAHLHQVRRMSLEVTWDQAGTERTTYYDFEMGTDAIFLTESASEVFLFPKYHATYGPAYVQALRTQLLTPAAPPPSSQP